MSVRSLAWAWCPPPLKPIWRRIEGSPLGYRLAHGAFWSLLGSAISRLLVLIAMIWVGRVLGKVSFGEFGLIQATVGVAGLMAGLGLGGTATRFVAQYAATDPGRAGRVIGLVVQTSWVTVLVAAGVLVGASSLIASQVLDAPHLQSALIWGTLVMAANVLRGIQSGIIAAVERFDLIAKLNVLEGVVSLIAMVVLAHYMGVRGALLGLAAASIAVWTVGRVILGGVLQAHGIIVKYRGCWQDWRILHGYSLPSLLANLVATPVLWFCMTWVAQRPNGYAELGLYNAAYQWHGPMIFIPMVLMSVSIPVLVQEWEAGRRERFRTVTLWICSLMLACTLPPVALIAALSPWVMSLYGPGFLEGWLILVLLVIAAPLHALAKIASGALFAINRAWWVLGVNLFWGVTILTLTLWLTPRWGAEGLAVAFLVAYSVLGITSVVMVLLGSRSAANKLPCVVMS